MSDGPESGTPRRPPGPTRREAVRALSQELEAYGIESAYTEAERLVAHALGVERADLTIAAGESLGPEEAKALARAVARRLQREPLQHIEGAVAFRELVLVSDRRALIPRPETEELVERIAEWRGTEGPVRRALDIGTGSGAIALALLQEKLASRVVALDISSAALEQAAENRARLGIGVDRLELRKTDRSVWAGVDDEERFELVVSNPPYVAHGEFADLEPEVAEHEPREALDGGADGLAVIRRLIRGAPAHVASGGALFLEIGTGQAASVRASLLADDAWSEVEIERDLAGRDRFVRAIRASIRHSPGIRLD